MQILDIQQGSELWHQLREKHFCASDAATMLGYGKYKTRDELLKEKVYGITKEIDPATQQRFDRGHAAETDARKIIEEMLSEELYPSVMTVEVDGLPLLASLDGVTIGGDIIWENKLFRDDLAEAIKRGEVSQHYWPQLEQGLLIAEAEKAYFTTSDGTKEYTAGIWYESVPERRKQLIAGWKQFAEDLAAYEHVEVLPQPVAKPIMSLPSVSVQVQGSLAVISNLDIFGERLRAFIDGLDKNPSDDQAFANAESAIKKLGEAQDALDAAEASALAQTSSIDDMRRTAALYRDMARTTRLSLEKIVKTRKETVRAELISEARIKINDHLMMLNKGLGGQYLRDHVAEFPNIIKGKKTITSIRGALNDELARAKIAANEAAEKIRANLKTLKEVTAYRFLFNDLHMIIMKEPEDFALLIKSRVQSHAEAEEHRLEAERERIRLEEEAKARREVEARAEAERQRIRGEERARAQEEAKAQAAAAIQTPQQAVTEQQASVEFQQPVKRKIKAPTRPSDSEIISVLTLHYRVHESKVIEWLLDMDLQDASKRLSEVV